MGTAETNPFYQIFLQAPWAIARLRGPTHIIEFANGPSIHALGGRDLFGQPVRDALPELLGQPVLELLDQVYRTGEIHVGYETPVLLRRVEGGEPEEGFFSIVYQPTRGDDGRVEGMIVHAMEVTAQVRARREADVERQKRHKQEEAQAFLMETSAALSSTLDFKTTLETLPRLAVPRFADWCAIYMETEPGGPIDLAALVHADPAMATRIREVWSAHATSPTDMSHSYRRALATGRAEMIPDLNDVMLERFSSSASVIELLRTLDVRSWMVIPLAAHKRVFGVITFGATSQRARYRDEDLALAEELGRRASSAIDHAQLFEAARRDRARAEEANRAKDEFLAMISHELRTPLTAVLGWMSMLRSGVLSEEKRRRALDTVERNARAQQQLIEDLLDISRVVSGKLKIDVSPIDPCRIVEAALDVVRPAAAARAIHLAADLDRHAGVILGDPDRLQQVFWNLLTNAVKFTPEGGRVEVSLRRQSAHVDVVVSDNGKGIRAEFMPYVFDRFRQADAGITRVHGGLGLGLSIVRFLVELHGGTITATSEGEGRGASFAVRLPASAAMSARVDRPPARPAIGEGALFAGSSALSNVRVLVVDDEEDARELLVTVLSQCQAEVIAASAASEALRAITQTPPDVIVSDIGMPEEDGYSLIRRVRALPDKALSQIPAVALTAYARAEDRTRAMLEGFNIHVPKPIEPSELIAVVQSLTGRIPTQRATG